MLKFLKGVVGSGGGIKDLPYNIGEPYSTAWGGWAHFRGTSKDDNSPVSIFSYTGSNAQDARLAAARNGAKRLRVVRHPNVLAFLHSTEVENIDGGVAKPTIYLVTEPVMPLSEKIQELDLQGTQRNEYYAWGLNQIARAVSFLNNDCKLQYDWLVGTQFKSLELAKSDWTTIRKSPPWALDSWGLGCLIYELFSSAKLAKTEDLRNTSQIPKTLLPDYQKLLASAPVKRLNSAKLLENSEFFHNKLVETIQFMEILNLKDSVEKDVFFRKLPTLAEQLPRPIVTKKLLPLLSSALEFGSAAAPALNPLLKIGSWLSQDEFNVKVLPTVIKLFASTDRAIRVGLLQHIDSFGAGLSTQVVDEQIFSHIATGFADTSAFLRELTLKSMLLLAPKLSQRTITGSLLKHLSKLQVDEEPAIRTNTTILLGNIASHLNDATRKRVLINAFTVRALRDGFAPARVAGIMALMATAEYYDATEIATRILPHLVVLTVDSDSDVRTRAFQATEQFVQSLKDYYSKLQSGDPTAVAAPAANVASAGSLGLLGWAVGSLASKKSNDLSSAPAEITSGSTIMTASASQTAAPPSIATHTSAQPRFHVDEPATASPTSNDGWGDAQDQAFGNDDEDEKDGWGDMDLPAEPALALSRIRAAQQKPVTTQPKPVATSTSSPVKHISRPAIGRVKESSPKSSDGWGDDDDPWAAIAAPAPSTTARPLNPTASRPSSLANGPRRQPQQAQHVSIDGASSRGRGRAAPMKLGASRIQRTSD
uniref:Protein kinase domain-containing protein n=1 Tax=Physcomitrium patens TaxID=3218 RepID=A0A7I4DFP3_PHYPA